MTRRRLSSLAGDLLTLPLLIPGAWIAGIAIAPALAVGAVLCAGAVRGRR